jgi:glycosyltransferase involved in cell wall biosynthesis
MKARVIQVIDNLGFGGAESMAVNIANLLHNKGHFSAICATRVGGVNEEKLDDAIPKLILDRKKFFDFTAIKTFKNFCNNQNVQIVQAHSSSIFFVVQAKLFGLKAKIIWHDHSGVSQAINDHSNFRKVKGGWKHYVYNWVITRLRFSISYVISVNDLLANWAVQEMKMPREKVLMLENFPFLTEVNAESNIELPGKKGKRIVLLANIRKEKAHQFALEVAKHVLERYPDWSFLFVGKNFENQLFTDFSEAMKNHPNTTQLHYLGGRTDVADILNTCDIGILTSSSEGLPVVILEYGFSELPVVTTDVGQCGDVVGEAGFVVPFGNVPDFSQKLIALIEDQDLRDKLGKSLKKKVLKSYSADAAFNKLLQVYQSII